MNAERFRHNADTFPCWSHRKNVSTHQKKDEPPCLGCPEDRSRLHGGSCSSFSQGQQSSVLANLLGPQQAVKCMTHVLAHANRFHILLTLSGKIQNECCTSFTHRSVCWRVVHVLPVEKLNKAACCRLNWFQHCQFQLWKKRKVDVHEADYLASFKPLTFE